MNAIVLSALSLLIACGGEPKDPAADDTTANENSAEPGTGAESTAADSAATSAPDGTSSTDTAAEKSGKKLPLTDQRIATAKEQSERIWAKHGSQIMAQVLDHQLRVFAKKLEELHGLVSGKKHKEAIDEYKKTIKDAKPNDSRLWTELAELAWSKKDTDLARVAASNALWRPIDLRVRARALHVLARIAEREGDKKGAITYLRHARLAAPKDAEIAKALSDLAYEEKNEPLPELIGSAFGPLGPSKDTAALCEAIKKGFPTEDPNEILCTAPAAWTRTSDTTGIKSASIATLRVGNIHRHHILAIQTDKGWFAVTQLAYESGLQSLYSAGDKFQLSELDIRQVIPDGAPEVVVRFLHSLDDTDPGLNEKQVSTRKEIQLWTAKDNLPLNAIRLPYALTATHSVLSAGFEKAFDSKSHSIEKLPVKFEYEIEPAFDASGKLTGKTVSGTVPRELQALLSR